MGAAEVNILNIKFMSFILLELCFLWWPEKAQSAAKNNFFNVDYARFVPAIFCINARIKAHFVYILYSRELIPCWFVKIFLRLKQGILKLVVCEQ